MGWGLGQELGWGLYEPSLMFQHYGDELEPQPVVSAELKLVSVPVVFLLLRIWSLILVLIEVEIGYDLTSTVSTFLLYMSVSVHM